MAQVQANDEAAFEAVFMRHYERIYSLLFRLLGSRADAEDMAQQVFIKLYHAPDRLHLADDNANVVGWLYRVAINEGYNALRSRKRRSHWHEQFARLWPFGHTAPDPAHLAESRDTQSRVRQVLADMKPRDAKLLLLRHSGLAYRELAEILDLAPGSIGSLLTQAKRTFAQKYRAAFPEETE